MSTEEPLETIYMFAGTGGAMAYSDDERGANLPANFGPWRFRQAVSTSGPTFNAGADTAALDEVMRVGFAVAVYKATFEDEP